MFWQKVLQKFIMVVLVGMAFATDTRCSVVIYDVPSIDELQAPEFVYRDASWGQTFVIPDNIVYLNRFIFYLYKGSETVNGVTVTLWESPERNEALADFYLDPSIIPLYYSWNAVDTENILVTPNSQYYLEMTSIAATASDEEAVRWPHLVDIDHYSLGRTYQNSLPYANSGADKVMKIEQVDVPESSCLLFFGCSCLALLSLWQKKKNLK